MRGMQALDAHSVLTGYFGTLVHDGWASHCKLVCEQGLCGAHLLRVLLFARESTKQA
jgi:hypothetical protein